MSNADMDIDGEEGAVAQVQAPEGAGEAAQRFEIKKWTAVAFWSWDIEVDNCAICRNHIMEPCIECQPKAMSDTENECVAAWGICNHAFHLHCINKWIKTRDACPLDNQKWVLARCGR